MKWKNFTNSLKNNYFIFSFDSNFGGENGKVKISGLMKETVVEMYDLMGEGEEKNE